MEKGVATVHLLGRSLPAHDEVPSIHCQCWGGPEETGGLNSKEIIFQLSFFLLVGRFFKNT